MADHHDEREQQGWREAEMYADDHEPSKRSETADDFMAGWRTSDRLRAPSDRVYLVMSAAYGDYLIESVWANLEAAEESIRGRRGDIRIEGWLVNDTTERTVVEWEAWIDQDNGEIRVGGSSHETSSPGVTRVVHSSTMPLSNSRMVTAEWYGYGYGASAESAREALAGALAKAKEMAASDDQD